MRTATRRDKTLLTAIVQGLLVLAGVAEDVGGDVGGGQKVRHDGRSNGKRTRRDWWACGLETGERDIRAGQACDGEMDGGSAVGAH
jgi:hypothetical protein